jgi:hypothetical protein
MQAVTIAKVGWAIAPCKISKLFVAGLAVAWFAAVGLQASGAIIYANYDGITPGGSGSYSVSLHSFFGTYISCQKVAVCFTTDGSTYQLDSVTLNLNLSSGDSSDLSVGLCDDSGSLPGASLGRLTNPSSIEGQNNYTFTTTGLTLAPDTTYWIVAEPLGEMEVGWADTVSSLGWACADTGSYSLWGPWEPGQGTYGSTPSLMVNGTTAVPEPSTYSLLALGFVALLGSLRLRRRSS